MNNEIKEIVKRGESQHLEFKTALVNAKSIAREVCAFANSGGGLIAVGIGVDGTVVGIKATPAIVEKLRSEILTSISPTIAVSITPIETEGKTVLLIDVPEGFDRPYTFEGKAYTRIGDRTTAADGPAIKEILSSSRGHDSRWERRPVLGMNQNEIDDNELLGMKNTLVKSGMLGNAVAESTSGPELLEILNLAESGRCLNSALVLFGKHPAKRYPQMRVRAVAYSDDKGNKITDNRFFEGHGFKILSELIGFLHRHVNISSEIPLKGLQRKEGPVYPSVAIREALMNAIQHRDYESFDGGMSVTVYPGRIEIWNSGTLPSGMTIQDLKKPHYSRPYNPDIAHVFFLRGYVERIGSGIHRIIEAFRQEQLPEPVWNVNSGGICAILMCKPSEALSLNERQIRLLKEAKAGAVITRKEYRNTIGKDVSDRQASIDLQMLVAGEFFSTKGKGRSVSYTRSDKKIS
jgi:ATP-dependent DNA helicase RecG